jgi:hypothetical protein
MASEFSKTASRIDGDEILGSDACFFQSDDIFLNLLEAAGSDENRSDCRAGENPGEGELGECLIPIRGDFVEGSNAAQDIVGEVVRLQKSMGLAGSGACFDTLQVAVCEESLSQRAEGYAACSDIRQNLRETLLDPPVEEMIPGLVNEERNASGCEETSGAAGRVGGIV